MRTLVERIDALLPQTQCTRCGFPACKPYAEALAAGTAAINQCPPGGAAGIAKLAALLDRPLLPLNPVHGVEGPLLLARIDALHCIGCTLCIQACPTDAIVGAPQQNHTVIAAHCTGCALCLPPCPVDCIDLVAAPFDWDDAHATAARARFEARQHRLAAERQAAQDKNRAEQEATRKQAIIAAALARARQQRPVTPKP